LEDDFFEDAEDNQEFKGDFEDEDDMKNLSPEELERMKIEEQKLIEQYLGKDYNKFQNLGIGSTSTNKKTTTKKKNKGKKKKQQDDDDESWETIEEDDK
jgi:hypothetical protein